MTYVPKVYKDKGGDRLVIAPGGELRVLGTMSGFPPTTDYYVDTTNGASINDGLSWLTAKATISQAMTLAAALGTRGRARIFVAPGGYTEDIVTPLDTECPFGQLIAVNPTGQSYGAVWLVASSATTATITVRARGWLIDGFEIDIVTSGFGVLLDGTTANSTAAGTQIRNCIFVGGNQAGIGIDVTDDGAPYTQITYCHFSGFQTNAISCSDSSTDQPRFWDIDYCTFVDNSNHIDMDPRGFKESQIHNCNFFATGANQSPTVQLDNAGGNGTLIGPNNFLDGNYDTGGGYVAGSSESWRGNHSQDSENGSAQVNPTA